MKRSVANMALAALALAAFAAAGVGLVALTEQATRERIADNERAWILVSLHQIVAPDRHDNDLLNDIITVSEPELLGTVDPVTVYRARMGGEPVAAILMPLAAEGYGGPIRLLVGVSVDGTLSGVRVVSHRETPGLGGDDIDASRSDWITRFAGLSLDNPPAEKWAVKRDGGAFDQFTGATITPRAVVKGIYHTLLYFREHQAELFVPAEPAAAGESPEGDSP